LKNEKQIGYEGMKIDRKVSIQEVAEKIFGIIPKFKSKDELPEEEFDKFISIYPPEKM